MTTVQKVIIGAVIAAAVGTGIYQAHQASSARAEVQALQNQQAEQIQQLTSQRDDAIGQLTALREENKRLTRNTAELLKLRGEVARLRKDAEAARTNERETVALDTQPGSDSMGTNNLPVQTFSASVRTNVLWNHAIVTGGWKLPSGNRAVVVIKVAAKPADRNEQTVPWFVIEPRYLEFSEATAEKLGLQQLNTNDKNVHTPIILSPAQYQALFTTASGSEGVRILTHGATVAINNNPFGIPFRGTNFTQSGTAYSATPYVDVQRPIISSDGQSVDLPFVATLKYSSTIGP